MKLVLLLVIVCTIGCDDQIPKADFPLASSIAITEENDLESILDPAGKIIEERFPEPKGTTRESVSPNSFQEYLRKLPMKADKSEVKLYDGTRKMNTMAYEAVVDLEIGKQDLHQCADVIMRLKAEYLWNQEKYDQIHFNFTNGFRVDYSEWMKGKRIAVNGNNVSWQQSQRPSNNYDTFWAYLETVFTYAGTLSLSNELVSVKVKDIKIGDVFIRGGSPGHAVIVVDVICDESTQKKYFMLAQSYMPAQEIHILSNPKSKTMSPWYSDDFGDELQTAEWVFKASELKRFAD